MKNILIIGGGKGIGLGLAQLLRSNDDNNVIVTSRNFNNCINQSESFYQLNCDIKSLSSINNMYQQLTAKFNQLDWVINCAGILHTDDFSPEKSLAQVSPNQMMSSYQTNTLGHLLILQKLEKLIKKSAQPIVSSISARIGSISDNKLGGWYSYRMSKAALNMAYKTLEIEWSRKYPHIKLLLVHPGTTDTALSKPFQRNISKNNLQSTKFTAKCIIERINDKLTGRSNHLFIDYKGIPIEW